nr:hypothetical protein [Tanacetum cinerariifolium]
MVGLPTWNFKEVVEKGMGLYPLILELLKAQKGGKGVCKLSGKGCTVYSGAQCFKYGDGVTGLLELMLLKRPKENTKCVSAADEELTAARHKLKLLV